ncbi:MAG: hypothetical protein Unbinned4120contig1000_33 [Prokaryotic dsDNA virus sp.]|jgi:hypothetical protein|nr:MAG: hypothetical protein Unbinned4120contig1000_33 [Prokaryotic dsDNA virus sp.]|tara:strand:- start:32497 stop:33012 length:516 start_codon:yes stop_codon:yes gene_type:complete
MPFEPVRKSPKAQLDRWALLCDSDKQGKAWIHNNLHVFKQVLSRNLLVVAPIFDLDDPFEIVLIYERQHITFGINLYQMMDIRGELARKHDQVLEESSMLRKLEMTLRHHPEGPRAQHPHPNPPTWEDFDRYDMRRRWISPDPYFPSDPEEKTRLFPTPPARKNPRDLGSE